jgi:hypothetical protein
MSALRIISVRGFAKTVAQVVKLVAASSAPRTSEPNVFVMVAHIGVTAAVATFLKTITQAATFAMTVASIAKTAVKQCRQIAGKATPVIALIAAPVTTAYYAVTAELPPPKPTTGWVARYRVVTAKWQVITPVLS